MTNPKLAQDYAKRAHGRLVAIKALYLNGLFADVVRECQEACELGLKSLIRQAGHAVPFSHDVSEKLRQIRKDLPAPVQHKIERLCEISKTLRRDRELSFYGSEDITPSEFYEEKDAKAAIELLREVLTLIPSERKIKKK